MNDHGEVVKTSGSTGSTALFDTVTVRDKLGRVASRTETTLGEAHKLDYRYDVRGRLIEVLRDGVSSAYSYDKNGNRTGAAGIAASYDAQDRLLTLGTLSYAYTPSGHLAKKTDGAAITAYSYDALGNLLSATLPDGAAIAYVIDAQGRRIGKKVNGALVKRWLYRNRLQPVAEVDASGAVVARYVYGSRPNVPDQIIQGGATYQIISDELGSPRLVVNVADDTVAQRIDYDVWGNVLSDSAPGFQPFGFAGGQYDADTKLVRFGARDYDAQSGRWTAKDPILFRGKQANLLVYVGNDPVNRIDPAGAVGFYCGGGIGAALGFGVSAGGSISGGFFVDFTFNGITIGGYSSRGLEGGVGLYASMGGEAGVFTSLDAFKGYSTTAKIDVGLVSDWALTSGATGVNDSGFTGGTSYGAGGGLYAGAGVSYTEVLGVHTDWSGRQADIVF